MSDEEIKKFEKELQSRAEAYAHEIHALALNCLCFVKVLMEDYCIVPKDKARELAKLTFENGGSEDYGLIDGLTDWVYENFSNEYHDVVDNGE